MAFIRLTNKKCVIVPSEKAIAIWRVLNGEVEGTKAQKQFCDQVHSIYLNRHNAPDSYLEVFKDRFPIYRNHRNRRPLVPAGQTRLPYKD